MKWKRLINGEIEKYFRILVTLHFYYIDGNCDIDAAAIFGSHSFFLFFSLIDSVSIYLYLSLSFYLSIYPSIYLSIYLSISHSSSFPGSLSILFLSLHISMSLSVPSSQFLFHSPSSFLSSSFVLSPTSFGCTLSSCSMLHSLYHILKYYLTFCSLSMSEWQGRRQERRSSG